MTYDWLTYFSAPLYLFTTMVSWVQIDIYKTTLMKRYFRYGNKKKEFLQPSKSVTSMFFFSLLQTQIIIKEYGDFENQQILCDYIVESFWSWNHFQNDIVRIKHWNSKSRKFRSHNECLEKYASKHFSVNSTVTPGNSYCDWWTFLERTRGQWFLNKVYITTGFKSNNKQVLK